MTLPLTDKLADRLLPLHAAVDHQALWAATRDLLRAAMPLHRLTLFLGHIGMREARVVFTDPTLPDSPAWYAERGKINPFSRWIEDHINVRSYRFEDVVGPPATFRASEFYERFAAPEGWDKGFSGLFWKDREVRAMFSLYRAPDQPAFSDDEVATLHALMPHLEVAIDRVRRLHREQNFRAALEDFSRTMPVPVMLLDWSDQLVFANHAAYESCAIWNHGPEGARRYNVRDAFAVPGAVQEILVALRDDIARLNPASLRKEMPRPRVVTHPGQPARQARVSPAFLSESSLARPGFFVLFHDSAPLGGEGRPWDADERIRALQQLTPAERELVHYVCLGYRNAEIAAHLNKSLLTVKTQLHSVFRKLGVSSRTKLVALAREPH